MQQKSLRIKSYRTWKVNEIEVSDIARERFKKLELFWKLRDEKCSESTALSAIDCGRATMYRWQRAYKERGIVGLNPQSTAPIKRRTSTWSKALEQQVLHLRRKHPLWGKKTLATILNRDQNLGVSISMVGRILKKLAKLGKIRPVSFYYGKVRPKKPRVFKGHAERWKKGSKSTKPGELLQIDHMTVNVGPGFTIKHFEATCPVTKVTIARAYSNASSKTAAKFLKHVIDNLPFEIISIQVDGGSEFRKDFEQACKKLAFKLYVLPPRSPELNGCVERCNRTFRYEFYRIYDGLLNIQVMQKSLDGFIAEYNSYRPHQALNQDTPLEYYHRLAQEAA